MKRIFLFIIIFSVNFIVSCDSSYNTGLSKEQAVYESLFLKIKGNSHEKYYLAQYTESEWFSSNPFNESDWESDSSTFGGIDIDTIKRLYQISSKSESLNWKPLITNGVLLSSKIGVDSLGKQESCLVEMEQGNIGIVENGKGYRSYYTVSRVAFTSDQKKAILKFSLNCSPLSGGREAFVVLEFIEQQWKIVTGKNLWIS